LLQQPFIFPFFTNLENNKGLLLNLVHNGKFWHSNPPIRFPLQEFWTDSINQKEKMGLELRPMRKSKPVSEQHFVDIFEILTKYNFPKPSFLGKIRG